MTKLLRLLAIAAVLVAVFERPAAAAGQVTTCVSVDEGAKDREGLIRLVESEVARHPSHRVGHGACETHLRVEMIEIHGERFITGRIDGEVPQRVAVAGNDARALEAAVTDLLQTVLGNDPVVLHPPGEQSFFGARLLELRDLGRNSLDVAAVEAVSVVPGGATFQPGLMIGFTREVSVFQVSVEALFAERLSPHPGRLDLDTLGRLQITTSLYFSKSADVAGFAGASLGLGYDRFTGPRGAGLGRGDGEYSAVGPGLGLRGGVELFRTTTTRVTLFAEAFVPMFAASDEDTEIVHAWVPTLALCAGARF